MTDANKYYLDNREAEQEEYEYEEIAEDNMLLETRIEELEAKLKKAVEALDEAVYLLAPNEKDMMKKAGVYRIVTTLAVLKGEQDE